MYKGTFTAQLEILTEIPDKNISEYKPFDELQTDWIDSLGPKIEELIIEKLIDDKEFIKICQVNNISAHFEQIDEGDDNDKKQGELQILEKEQGAE